MTDGPPENVLLSWTPPDFQRVEGIVRVRDAFVIVTDYSVWIADKDYDGQLRVRLLHHLPPGY